MTWHVSLKTPKQELFTAISTATPPQTKAEGEQGQSESQEEETDQLSKKEEEKINQAAELVQKQYQELRQNPDVSVEKLLGLFLEKNQKLGSKI